MQMKIKKSIKIRQTFLSILLIAAMLIGSVPVIAFAADPDTLTLQNDYIKVVVSTKNGGYTISTLEGDILKKSDDNKALTHRGDNFDTSFTSFQINDSPAEEYIFGNDYGFLGLGSSSVITESDSVGVTSTWSVGDLEIIQRIELVNGEESEQLGTALINYTVTNKSGADKSIKSRILMDTQLGENDFGYYEVAESALGAGYSFIDHETVISGPDVPADYFVKDAPFEAEVAAFGVNSALSAEKPYQMTFAHWANIASSKFEYTADPAQYFSNTLNSHRTTDSAVALYYDLGNIPANEAKTFSTFYGVTANLKNKDNRVIVNTTAPTKLEFNEDRTAFIGSSGQADNRVRISTTVTNPLTQGKSYRNLAVAIYTIGFTCMRQLDSGTWVKYNNTDPLYTNIVNFVSGQNNTTFFDFEFEPRNNHELGSFVTKVFDMDPSVNPLGVYADEYCLGETTNYIFIPAIDPTLPSITLSSLEPNILYNDARRYLTVNGMGMSFFQTALSAIELRGENRTYQIPMSNMNISQDAKSISLLLNEYMEVGRYQLVFLWNGNQPSDIPDVFTSSAMYVHLTNDEAFRNDAYGVVSVWTDGNQHWINSYATEQEFKDQSKLEPAGHSVLLTMRGDLITSTDGKEFRIGGKDSEVNINHILQYKGSDFTVTEESGSVRIEMDGKITTIGANTTVRNGTSHFEMKVGTKYVVPVYDARGELISGDSLKSKEEYLQLKWGNALDVIQSIGGFLVNLQFGVMGKIMDEKDSGKLHDIMSFGGALDLSFMTPGGAAVARENQNKSSSWTVEKEQTYTKPYVGWGTGGGTGKIPAVERAPETSSVANAEIGANVHNILYGQNGNKTGYLGINMEAHIGMPQIVSFLPASMSGTLSLNTIGGYRIGIDGQAEAATFNMAFSLVIKSNPSGAPIPDKMFFSIGGFEPGINVDGLGIFWVTGGGGGFDNLYDTIYGTDGIPPFKLLLNVQFDIFKVMTGAADLGLSLRSFSISLSDVSLKMIKNAKFLNSGYVGATWYPNFDLNVSASVSFQQVFKGRFSLTANEEFFEMMLRVALAIPGFIPIIGGMELASAELGGGTEKMWGRVEVLKIGLGFVYWWDSGDLEFNTGRSASARTLMLFNDITEPVKVGQNPDTGESQYMSVGTNLSYAGGSVKDASLTPQKFAEIKKNGNDGKVSAAMARSGNPTTVLANSDFTQHVVTFGDPTGDYILTVSRVDGGSLGADFQNKIKMWNDGAAYPLNFYQSTGYVTDLGEAESLSDSEKTAITNAANNANVNVVGNVAYIAVPKIEQINNPTFLVEFLDGIGYDVGAVFVEPIGELENFAANLENDKLKVSWAGKNLSETATITVSISDEPGEDGIVLAEGLSATSGSGIEISIPDYVASGKYTVSLTLIDAEKCYDRYDLTEIINITDAKAPGTPSGVTLANAGNNKLRLTIADNNIDKSKLEGYYVDVYEDGRLIEAALFYSREQAESGKILIGGRYDVPIMEEYTDANGDAQHRQITDANGVGLYQTLGFTPGKQYSVKVRAGGSELDSMGESLYHFSGYTRSDSVVLLEASPPSLDISADGWIRINEDGIGSLTANSVSTVKLTANKPVKGTLSVGGGQGESYEFDGEYRSEWTKELSLPDGVHVLEFSAEDAQGNRSIYQTTVSVDTTAPVLMLESPVSGGSFTNNSVVFKGIVDSDALYTFKVDGEIVGYADSDISDYITDSVLDYTLTLPGNDRKHMLEITAKDRAGNTTIRRMEVSDYDLPVITQVAIFMNGKPVGTEVINLESVGDAADLRLMGITASKDMVDITDLENVSFAMAGGSAISLTGGRVEAVSDGECIILASLDLGGGFMLYDAVSVTIGDGSVAVSNIIVTGSGGANSISANGGTLQLSAAVLPYNATNQLVTWTVESGGDSASVSDTGLVTAKAGGTAVIRATARDGTGVYGEITLTIFDSDYTVTLVKAPDLDTEVIAPVFSITNNSGKRLNLRLAISCYDADGRLITVKQLITEIENGQTNGNVTASMPKPYGTAYVKAFLWDEEYMPICGAFDFTSGAGD